MPVLRWLLREARITWQDLYSDRHELAAYLLALAFIAFIVFFYPFQP